MLVSELSPMHSNAGGGNIRQEKLAVEPAALGVFSNAIKIREALGSFPHMPSIPIFLKCGRFSPIPTSRLGKAGKQVRLSVQDLKGQTRDAIVTPISNRQEFNLRYHEWEYTRLQEVDTMSDGTIGNVNLRAMGHDDIGQWTRKFYPQTA